MIVDPAIDEVCLVLEYVEGGDSQKTDESGSLIPLVEKTIWSHLRHLTLGLEYLHMHGIIHGDIKPENLLLTRSGEKGPRGGGGGKGREGEGK